MGYMHVKGHSSGQSSNENFNHPPRPSKKLAVIDLFKKILESGARGQNECDTTLGMYRKCSGISATDSNKDGESSQAMGHSRKKSVDNLIMSRKRSQGDSTHRAVNPSGLENLGNTCYLSAIMQCLRSTEVVRNYCIDYERIRKQVKTSDVLFPAFASLIVKMQSTTNGNVSSNSIMKFKSAFANSVPCYRGNLQQDALEFFTYLLDVLHLEIRESTSSATPSPTECPSPSVDLETNLPSTRERRTSRRRGGLKSSESSGHLGSAGGDSSALDSLRLPRIRKISRTVKEKLLARTSSYGRMASNEVGARESCHNLLSSADTIAADKSFLKDTFVGHLQHQLRCLKCKKLTTRDELFWNLALCVPELPPSETSKESKEKASSPTSPSSSSNASTPTTPKPAAKAFSSSSSSTTTSTSNAADSAVSLDDCLKSFTKPETLNGLNKPFCSKCNMATEAQVQVKISQLPKILVLQFQRVDSSCYKNKRRHLIKFDFEQNMAPFFVNLDEENEAPSPPSVEKRKRSFKPPKSTSTPLLQPLDEPDATAHVPRALKASLSRVELAPLKLQKSVEEAEAQEKEKEAVEADLEALPRPAAQTSTHYRLYAVVYHQGGTDRGHYTARCRLPVPHSQASSSSASPSSHSEEAWYFFDDDNVSKVGNMKEVIQPTAYILFYERVDPGHHHQHSSSSSALPSPSPSPSPSPRDERSEEASGPASSCSSPVTVTDPASSASANAGGGSGSGGGGGGGGAPAAKTTQGEETRRVKFVAGEAWEDF